jgi:hypothetical protein
MCIILCAMLAHLLWGYGKLISIFSLHHFQQANLGDVIALNSIFKIRNTINSDTYNLHNFIKENNEK